MGSHCTPRAVQERIKKLKIMAKNDNVSSPDSAPSKAFTAAIKKAAVPKSKANAKFKASKGNVLTLKKRKTNNGGIAAISTDSDEGSLIESDSTPSKKAHPRAINRVKTTKPVLVNKRKIDEMLVFGDGNNSHTAVKEEDTVVKEEPFILDGDLSDSKLSFLGIFATIDCNAQGLRHVSAASASKTYFVLLVAVHKKC